ncbi:MAG: hypothetical protein ACJ787_20785 [Myxococcales bacterium]
MTTTSGGEDRDLRDQLRQLRVEAPDGGFSASLHRRLVAAGTPDAPGWWRRFWPALRAEPRVLWPAIGIAAGLAVFLVLGQVREFSRHGGGAVVAQLPATKVAIVRVNLSAEVAVETAHIRIRLPEGLYFWADGEELPQRTLEWSQPLRAGDNDIPIAVRGQKPGRYRLTVNTRIGEQRIDDEVLLEVVEG